MRSAAFRRLLCSVLVTAQLLLPIALAMQGAGAAAWSDICTIDGIRRVPAPDAPASQRDGDHCPLCRVAQTTPGVAPAIPALAVHQAVHESPPPADGAPATRLPRHEARARAPPPAG
jgi:hypothetical protein